VKRKVQSRCPVDVIRLCENCVVTSNTRDWCDAQFHKYNSNCMLDGVKHVYLYIMNVIYTNTSPAINEPLCNKYRTSFLPSVLLEPLEAASPRTICSSSAPKRFLTVARGHFERKNEYRYLTYTTIIDNSFDTKKPKQQIR